MSPIVPAIIPKTFDEIGKTLRIVSPFTHEVQIDIVDGVFVPFISWPYQEPGTITDLQVHTGDFLIEMDLMIQEPETVIEAYAKTGVRRIVVHLETVTDLNRICTVREKYDFKLGFSINNDTPLEMLTAVIDSADYVQLMGIAHIGTQGQPFDERVLGRIRTLRHAYPELLISIDGSVNLETVGKLAHAGAGRCISGSAILKAHNPPEAYTHLVSLHSISVT